MGMTVHPAHHHPPLSQDAPALGWCAHLKQAHDIGQIHNVEGIIQLVLLNQLAGNRLDTIRSAWDLGRIGQPAFSAQSGTSRLQLA